MARTHKVEGKVMIFVLYPFVEKLNYGLFSYYVDAKKLTNVYRHRELIYCDEREKYRTCSIYNLQICDNVRK